MELKKDGFRVLIFNPRGSQNKLKKTDPIYDFREIDQELKSIVNHVDMKYPSSNIYLVGFSFGASIAMKYVSKH